MNKYHVLDFNGTIYEPRDEGPTYKAIAHAVKDEYMPGFKPRFWGNPSKLISLLGAKKKLEAIYERIKATSMYDIRREQLTREIYSIFNREVIDGISPGIIHIAVEDFAETAAEKVDERILEPIRENVANVMAGILSVAWKETVECILGESGYLGLFNDMNIVGDTLKINQETNKAKGFDLRTYGIKAEFLEDWFFKERRFKPAKTVYWGDGPDDEQCFDLVTSEGGVAALPLMLVESGDQADRAFVEDIANRFNAFVPENAKDLSEFIKKS